MGLCSRNTSPSPGRWCTLMRHVLVFKGEGTGLVRGVYEFLLRSAPERFNDLSLARFVQVVSAIALAVLENHLVNRHAFLVIHVRREAIALRFGYVSSLPIPVFPISCTLP